jgi:LEA14-like dessication related protein
VSKRFYIFLGVGVVIVVVGLFFVFSSTKGAHLQLQGKVLKVRTGELDPNSSAAVVDFRVQNPSDVPFVVREVKVTLENADGSSQEGSLIAKTDLKVLLSYNRFLGAQYNEALSLQDRIPPRATVDRMVAVRFEVPLKNLDHAKGLKLYLQDVDGPEWETEYRF